MKFTDQFEAKRYFVDKVILQSQKDNIPLTEAEKYMIEWTETDERFEVRQDLIDKFNEETTDADFEQKVSLMLKNAYSYDVEMDPSAKETYRNAYKTLKEGDHYIRVMIDDSIGSKLKKWGIF